MRVQRERPPTSYFAFVVSVFLGGFLYLGWFLGSAHQGPELSGTGTPRANGANSGLVLRADNSSISNVQGIYVSDQNSVVVKDSPVTLSAQAVSSSRPETSHKTVIKPLPLKSGISKHHSAASAEGIATSEPRTIYGSNIYIVRSDDTLTGIAKKCLGSAKRWREIARLNADVIADPHRLKPGVRLRLPGSNSRNRASENIVKYTVRESDSLYSLAVRFYATPAAVSIIRDANREVIENGNMLRPGMVLSMPVKSVTVPGSGSSTRGALTYTIKEGDTLSGISKRFYDNSTKYDLIIQANPQIKDEKILRVGAVIAIPPLTAN